MSVDGAGGRRRGRAFATALLVLACALVVPAVANAEELIVDSTTDQADALPGVGCLMAVEECTLRAAIEEANTLEGFDVIAFDEAAFDGQPSSTIVLGSSLPSIVDPVSINGRSCSNAAGVNGPCVGIDGPSAGSALIVEHAAEVEIWGLAVTGAQTGVSVESAPQFKAQASWFGIKLDGSAGGNGTGVLIGPGSDAGLIGSEGAERGNVLANSTGDGLDIHGASNVRVLGDYFGVKPDGTTPAANGKDIEVTSTPDGEFEAIGNLIGTRVGSAAVATPACDGGCNVISGAVSSGIDLEGDDGVAEAPAVATAIAGNYIGLNATGAAAVANASSAVRVGEAAQTVIGGAKVGEANRITGGAVGVLAGPDAVDLVVRGNQIGVDVAGSGSLAPPGEGISVNSEELSTPAVEAVIADNEIRMEGGVAIVQRGFGAWIFGNDISGAKTGIRTYEYSGEHGNLIEGNSIKGLEVNGILVENALNGILGNEISGAGGAGIRIQGSFPFDVTENLVGGNTAADENVIAGSGGNAIEISNVKETENEVARNRGIANSGLFIDLIAASSGTSAKGPNNGIEPPEFTTPAQASASGSGAKAGANVRVFRKQSAEAGELDSFLGEATADASGNWKVIYGSAIPGGTRVAATQTSEGGTSELASATTVAGEGSADGGGGGGETGSGSNASSSAHRSQPRTKIVRTPKKRSRSSTARFEFKSDELGSIFLCKLDGKPFDLCKSPKKYEGLKSGRHVFEVRAIDPFGHADSSPAKKKFTVLG